MVRGEIPAEIQRKVELWAGCVAGALHESDYRAKLEGAGFEAIEIEPTRIYSLPPGRQMLAEAGLDSQELVSQIENKFMSAFIVRASRPDRSPGSSPIMATGTAKYPLGL
jgi:hypothetical protein